MKNSLNKKEKIIKAAIELFGEKGLDGTSTRDISTLSNSNISLISYYFGGKDGLFRTIIENLFEKQKQYIIKFFNEDKFFKLSKTEQARMFLEFADKMTDFFYGEMGDSLLSFLLKEQHKISKEFVPPFLILLRKIISVITDKEETSREVVYQTLFVSAQINSPRIMKLFIHPYADKGFEKEDIGIIKSNLQNYIKMICKNSGIDL